MTGWLCEATQPIFATASTRDVAPLVRRFAQGGLAILADSSTCLLILIGWLLSLALVASLLQRDRRAWLRGLIDVRANLEQITAGLEIIRRNKRPLWVALGAAVLSWTGWSLATWNVPASRSEFETVLAQHANSATSFATTHAFASALVPLRDLVSLGDLLVLVLGACVILFARTGHISNHLRAKTRAIENISLKRRLGSVWVGLIILAVWRIVVFIVAPTWAPIGECMFIDILLIPFLMLVADGVLLAWLVAEFGRGARGHFDWEAEDTAAFVRTIPVATFTCFATNPGRYFIVLLAMWDVQVNQTYSLVAKRWDTILWAAVLGQIVGMVWFAFPGVLAVNRRRGWWNRFQMFGELWRRAGGRIVGLTVLGVLFHFIVVWPFYWIFGAMQAETWSLLGAASYGHYASLLLNLVMLAATTELAYQEFGIVEEPNPVATLLPAPPQTISELVAANR